MELNLDIAEMLDVMTEPVFLVQNNKLSYVNEAASRLFLRKELPIFALLETGEAEYAAFSGGVLHLTLSIAGKSWGATVNRFGNADLFRMDPMFENDALRILALAASELRGPLAKSIWASQKIAAQPDMEKDLGNLNLGLNQLLRIISNMSDASGSSTSIIKELQYVDALFRECIEKAAALAQESGVVLHYTGLSQDILCAVNWQVLERAALNMISNAIKYSGADKTIAVDLRQNGKQISFSVTNSGSFLTEKLQSTMFQRYQREPAIEDGRYGIGLGMLLIRNAAASHGGAVLVDHPELNLTRVTLTIAIQTETPKLLRSNPLKVDYAGEMDHVLMELSDCLPPELY